MPNKIIKALMGVSITLLTPVFCVSCSGNTGNDVVAFVSQSLDMIETKEQQNWVTLQLVGPIKVESIASIELIKDETNLLEITSSYQNIPVDDEQQFKVAVQLRNEPTKIENVKYGFVVTYEGNEGMTYATINDLSIQVDYHNITLLNPDPNPHITNDFVPYIFKVDGLIIPDEIQGVSVLGDHADEIDFETRFHIPLDENNCFTLYIKTKNIQVPAKDEFNFQIQAKLAIGDTVVVRNIDNCFYSYYFPSLSFISKSTDYLIRDEQLVDFVFRLQLPSEQIDHIDEVSIQTEEPLSSGAFNILNDEDVQLNEDGEFVLTCIYSEIDRAGVLDNFSFHFNLSFTTPSGLPINDYQTPSYTLTAYKEPSYDGTLVKITALDNCDVSIINNDLDSPENYNIRYILPGLEPIKYNLGDDGEQGDLIDLKAGESVEFKNDTGAWAQGTLAKYPSFSFSGPVMIQGDVTALLDGVGGQMTDLGSWNHFNSLFVNANVLKVSENFLRATTVGQYTYSRMFDSSKLIVAPNLPATNLNDSCYDKMFLNCKSLQIPPIMLPAEVVAPGSYYEMFKDCKALTFSPIILGKTSRAPSPGPGPEPPTYDFLECFAGCSSLREIYLPYWEEDWTYRNNFSSWVSGVSRSGIFFYNGDITTRGESAIPDEWEIKKWEQMR